MKEIRPVKLREARETRGWSVEKMARFCGVSRQCIALWEAGFTSPPIHRTVVIEVGYQRSVEDLFEMFSPEKGTENVE